ncbi:MAG TPA: fibronectin type III domain-containing protein, partial [Cellvibrio sp.]|nr:fibronectin type III domain-containing protein [Cellvibrio sp.]
MISYKTGFSRLFISLFHFFSIKLLIAFLPSVAYASIMSYSGSGGNYVINWNCTSNNYFCSLHKDGSEIYRSGSGEKSYPITLGVGQYEFVLRTYSIGNLGHVSLVDTDTITITNLPAPSTPSTPTVPSTNNTGSYTISWSSAANASRYTLEEKVGSGNWYLLGNPTGTSYNRTVTTSNTYYYRVQACNDASCSAFSPSSAGINVAITPGVPPTITAPALHDGDFNISWGSASGSVSKYDLDQSFNGGSYTNS